MPKFFATVTKRFMCKEKEEAVKVLVDGGKIMIGEKYLFSLVKVEPTLVNIGSVIDGNTETRYSVAVVYGDGMEDTEKIFKSPETAIDRAIKMLEDLT